jgi:organic hydroperoxide reductase OsmC/OhrA
MLATFPHRYSASLSRSFASRSRIEVPQRAGLGIVIDGPSSAPDGDIDACSPEHMLLSSLGLGMLTAFEALAVRDGIDLREWRAEVSGVVEETPEGPSFTSIVVALDLDVAGNIDQFEDALEEAKRCCTVQNVLRVPVVVETRLRTPFGAFADRRTSPSYPAPPSCPGRPPRLPRRSASSAPSSPSASPSG